MKWPLKQAGILFVGGMMTCAGVAVSQSATQPNPSAQTDAPPPPPPEGRHWGGPEHRVQMLQHALDLNADQTAQVKALLETEHTKMEAVHSNTALSPDDRRAQAMAIHQDTTTKMHALLTPEQATKYDSMEARMREHRPGGNPPPPPPPGPGDR